jgi:GH15 family glucan-1,4-alpha-glucosidase
LKTAIGLRTGDRVHFVLRWGAPSPRGQVRDPDRILKDTAESWRRWVAPLEYEGPQAALVRRSAVTLKLLDYFANGAILAAPTSSLPEDIGGERNWDYRYAWVRDCAFTVYGLHRIGLYQDARSFLGWVLDAVERGERAAVLYDIDGHTPPPEREDDRLEGYRGSRPVRWGNAAVDQAQNDVYGEIVDCAYQWGRHGTVEGPLWDEMHKLIEAARRLWRKPDRGIWEVRTTGRPFTYSVALCWVALDRGARLAERYGLPGDRDGWRREAERIRHAVIEEAWNPDLRALTQHLGGAALDASLLALPLRRLLPAAHPRMVATTAAIQERLGAGDGLLYRYLREEAPDGLAGKEGAFLLCSFWLADNLARQGRLEEASDLYDSLCARANSAGLLPEQIDPSSGAFLGNFPQAFSHVGVISSGVNLARELKRARERG